MSDKTDMQISLDTEDEKCHSEGEETEQNSEQNCCQDMSLCNISILYISNSLQMTNFVNRPLVQLPSIEHILFSINFPPTPPPKLIS